MAAAVAVPDTEGVFRMAERQIFEGPRHENALLLLRQLYCSGFVHPHIGLKIRLAVHQHLYAGALKWVAALHLHDDAAVPALPCPRKGALILRRIHHAGAIHHMAELPIIRLTAAYRSEEHHDQQYTSY